MVGIMKNRPIEKASPNATPKKRTMSITSTLKVFASHFSNFDGSPSSPP